MNYAEAQKEKKKLVEEFVEVQVPNEMPIKMSNVVSISNPSKLNEDDDDSELDDEWVEAFASGEHTDASGITKTWDHKDLEEIATKYNAVAEKQPAPVVLGHPEHDAPAYGWISAAKVVGDKLKLKLTELNKDFISALKSGAYKTRSISLYDDNVIRHLGFLGGSQPAIKGLKPLSFTENKPYKTFSEVINMPTKVEVTTNVADLEKELSWYKKLFNIFKVETSKNFSDPVVPTVAVVVPASTVVEKEDGKAKDKETVAEGKTEGADGETKEAVATENKEPVKVDTAVVVSKEEIATVKDEANTDQKENELLKNKVAELEGKLDAMTKAVENKKVEAQIEGNRAFCESLIKAGKLRPADLEIEVENLNQRDQIDSIRPVDGISDFSEAASKSKVEQYKAYLTSKPKVCEFGEVLPASDAPVTVPTVPEDFDAYLAKMVEDKMALNPKVSYMDHFNASVTECKEKNPEAFKEYEKKYCAGKGY